jgi:hypothetical protein
MCCVGQAQKALLFVPANTEGILYVFITENETKGTKKE